MSGGIDVLIFIEWAKAMRVRGAEEMRERAADGRRRGDARAGHPRTAHRGEREAMSKHKPMSDADLDAIDAAEKRLRGRIAPPDLAEEAMDIIAATPRMLAEIRQLRADAKRAAEEMRERAAKVAEPHWRIAAAIRALPTEPER
jgi:hypothetical protein